MISTARLAVPCAAALLWLAAAPAAAGTGEVCIAGFANRHPGGPNMDLPGPGPASKYGFRFDKKTSVAVGQGEMRLVEGLAIDHRLLVEVRLDGKRTEAFWLDLREQQDARACLWLYEGYWHWGITRWDDRARGCKCWDEAAP